MAAEKTIGIVVRIVEFSESSCIVTMLTRDFGKITAMAKGARRRKSPFEGALDLLSTCRIVFLHKTSEALDLLTEAKLERCFRSASSNLDRLYAGYYVAELVTAMTDEADPCPDLFELADDVLQAIDHGEKICDQLFRLEVGALTILGHKPMLEHCAGCGREKTIETKRVNFGLNAGGVFCSRCRQGKTNVVSLTSGTWESLVKIAENHDRETISKLSHSAVEMRKFLNQYMNHHLGYRPRLQKYISKIPAEQN